MPSRSLHIDTRGLEAALKKEIAGSVRFDPGSRALYASDSSNYRQIPIGVVVPRHVDDVLATLALCRRFGAPILGRGAGTSLAGQCCNVAVVIDTSKHVDRILDIDAGARTARVEPGVILDDLRDAAEVHGLTFGPDPATHAYCTLGGMIGNNSCGVHSVYAGKTDENVLELDVVAGDGTRMTVGRTSEKDLARIVAEGGRRGEIYAGLAELAREHAALIRSRYPAIPRRVSGYNLPYLLPESGFDVARALVGSEGTCAFVLGATVRLVPSPRARVLVVIGFSDVFEAADAVPGILEHEPIGLEGFDDRLVSDMERAGLFPENRKLLPEGGGWLLAEIGSDDAADALDRARRLAASLGGRRAVSARIFDRREEAARIWQVRQAALGATAHVPGQPQTWEGWEDAAVAPAKLGRYLRAWRALLDRHGYGGDFYGHFGQGCVHTRTDFDFTTATGVARFRTFLSEAADLVVSFGGSISGEHGDGQARGELLPKMFGPELVGAFRRFKAIWDPDNRMNPGKLVDPYPVDANLRLANYAPMSPELLRPAFAYANDAGSFGRALQRCVGVGECRRVKGGVMCPSFFVTREEKHTTRGRARLLDEMLRGEILTGGWREEAVREALDLCLACKGCKSDCPVGVDVATWKAEFLSRYYRGRLRPRSSYALGLAHRWARLASAAPHFANFLGQTPGLRSTLKALAGIAPDRSLPRFDATPFRRWFGGRRTERGGRPVLLFPDTFTSCFDTGAARAAVEVLEDAGFAPKIPSAAVCCGRPLFDFGMLDAARRTLRKVLDALAPHVAADVPVVVLEPSCAAVFKDELPNLFPGDPRAAALADRTFLLGGLLARETSASLAGSSGRALVQFHCHQRALFGVEDDRRVLSRAGIQAEIPDSGCCGMAGAFGFEPRHYRISMAIGERVILPAVRAASAETVIVADGFSCREQIAQATGRRPVHLAEVLVLSRSKG